MKNQRSFSLEFKRQAVEELLSGESRPAQLCRRYDSLLHLTRSYHKTQGEVKFPAPEQYFSI
jgi:transposase-like protein